MALSPMMQQYMDIKKEHEDSILFFRLGDFYEMFFNDAQIASKELGLTLTGRNCGMKERAPMCGVPFHSSEEYIASLVERGYKVAICEQVEDAAATKDIVKRQVVQIITPGTLLGGRGLKDAENNFLASIYICENKIGLCYCDISTGEMEACKIEFENDLSKLLNELSRIEPREILINEDANNYIDIEKLRLYLDVYFNIIPKEEYKVNNHDFIIKKQFNTNNIASIGIEENDICLKYSLGMLIFYLDNTQKRDLDNLRKLKIYNIGSTMILDKATVKNLELVETISEKSAKGSLLWVLDKTLTAMGSRKIKKWLKEPLNKIDKIIERLDAVEELYDNAIIRNNLREHIRPIYDFERIASKITYESANPKDLISLKTSLYNLTDIKYDLEERDSRYLQNIGNNIDVLEDVYDLINDAIVDDPPFSIREGGMIKEGFDDELDSVKFSIKDAKEWITTLEERERNETKISKLKVGYNKVFGYYIEITKSQVHMAPNHYIRKQTLVNAERYITPELKEMEAILLNAEAKINKREYEVFTIIRNKIKESIYRILKTSNSISDIDVLLSFAEVSEKNNYVKPEIYENDEIQLQEARHPVIENIVREGVFVPNDLYINKDESSLLLITGPNMAGKSTYMRQSALIVLMAQAGCFVPCEKAKIGVVDRIFTRIGASDNLIGGESTFYVEMNELAYILNNLSEKSLVILDEIGRGTSTYDGLSIAWATAEFLCKSDRKVRTLFASHYHELTDLENNLYGFKNLTVDVIEENGNVVFLHKIVDGSASRSYGIHVAKLAGAPRELVSRAEEKLLELEKSQSKYFDIKDEQIKFNF